MAGKSSTISNNATAIGAINIQQSSYGVTVPIMWGRNRLTGNLIWYGGFKAVPHTEVKQQGGKGGGGVKQSTTTYSYTASVMMALCRGPVAGVRTVWRGKSVYRGSASTASSTRVDEQKTVAGNKTVAATNTVGFIDLSVQRLITTDYTYDTAKPNARRQTLIKGIDYTVSATGVYTFASLAAGETVIISYTYASGAATSSALPVAGLNLASGTPGQAPWGYLTSAYPSQAVGYSTIAYVAAANYNLSEGAQIDNHGFEIDGPLQFASWMPDANPADIVPDALNNPIYGAGFGDDRLGVMADFRNACTAQGIFLSPVLNEQTTAADFLAALARLTNVGLVWSNGVLKFVPYADMPMTANGVTFTPATAPIYDLTDDDFLPNGGDPVMVNRGSTADTFNSVKLEYCDRANDYNLAIMPASDDADILENGLREGEVIQAHWVTDANVARVIVQLILQRSMFVRNTYEFRLKWNKIGLEAMDLVTLTDASLGLNKYAVRITEMEEDGEGELSFLAEDFPQGSASATLYPTTTGIGFAHNYNANPGNAGAPTIFEAPSDLTASNSGLEVWLATGSTAADYGGCEVWVSLDGSNYQRAYVLKGSSRYGVTTSTLAADANPGTSSKSVNVSLFAGGQMLSGSTSDRDRLTTLCYVGGEFIAYDAATLTGANAYRLGPSLNRGAYGSGVVQRNAGVPFVRCDEGIAKMTLTADYIGQTLHVKLLAFNTYQANTQGLADAVDYTYVVTGMQANLAPLAPPGVALEGPFTIDTAKFRWGAATRAASYNVQVWAGAGPAKVREVNVGSALRFDYSSNDAKADGGPWRALQLRVQGINENGAPGAFSTLSVSNPQVGALTGVRVAPTAGSLSFSCTVPDDPDFQGVMLWLSTTQGFTPGAGNLVYSGPNTSVAIGADTAGAALVPGTPYYLKYAGYDSFDKSGLTVGASDAVTLLQQQLYATVMMYKWSTSQPAAPIGTSIFNWGTGQNGSYSGDDGWFSTIQDNPGTPGLRLWVAVKSITALSGTTSTTVGYAGIPITSTATNATAGVQTAIASVYMWAATIPAGPAGPGVFNWSNGSIGTVPTDWSATAGAAPSLGMSLFAASVRLIDSSANTTTNFNWSSSSVMAIGYAPANGAAGASYVTAYCSSSTGATTTAPSTTQGKNSVPAANGGGIVGAWTKGVPVIGTNQYLYQSDGIYDPATDIVTWSIPYWSSLKVGTISAISANLGQITAGSIDLGAGANSWHVDSLGNMWIGAASFGTAPFRVSNTGAMVATNLTLRSLTGVDIVDPVNGLALAYAPAGTRNSELTPKFDAAANKGTAINDDPGLANPAAWELSGVTIAPLTTAVGSVGKPFFNSYASGGSVVTVSTHAIDPNKTYSLTANLYRAAGSTGNMYILIDFYNETGARIPTAWGGSYSGYIYGGLPPDGRFTRLGGDIGAGTTQAIPSNVKTAKIGVLFHNGATTANAAAYQQAAQDLRLEDVTAARAAKAIADAAIARADAAANDGILDRSEKADLVTDWQTEDLIYIGTVNLANAVGASVANYVTQHDLTSQYLLGLSPGWDVTTQDTPINRDTHRARFKLLYEARTIAESAIAAKQAENARVAALAVVDLGEADTTTFGRRGRNDPPVDYPTGTSRQFKLSSAISIANAPSLHCTLETVKQWVDSSGGGVFQYAYVGTQTFRRFSPNPQGAVNTWQAWALDLDRNSYTGELDATKGANASNLNVGLGGGNRIPNSGPYPGSLGDFSLGYWDTPGAPAVAASYDPWRPPGQGGVYMWVGGTPGTNRTADLADIPRACEPNQRYEFSYYVSIHRCTAQIYVVWYKADGSLSQYPYNEGPIVASPGGMSGPLSNWPRVAMFATAPADAVSVRVIARMQNMANDCYLFTSCWYYGVALPAQTVFSPWSDGPSGTKALSALPDKVSKSAANIMTGAGALISGTLTVDANGYRSGGYGCAQTQRGWVAYNSAGVLTFQLDAAGGSPYFAGQLAAAYGTFGALRVASGGYICSGGYDGWTGPAAGQGGGFTIAAQGAVWGNYADGRFVAIYENGDILAPGFSLSNKQLTLTSPVIVTPQYSAFSVSISGADAVSGTSRSLDFGTATATVVGSYASMTWRIDLGECVGQIRATTASTGSTFGCRSTVAVGVTGSNNAVLVCTVVHADGRVAVATKDLYAIHY